jgi:hypothetical protein
MEENQDATKAKKLNCKEPPGFRQFKELLGQILSAAPPQKKRREANRSGHATAAVERSIAK